MSAGHQPRPFLLQPPCQVKLSHQLGVDSAPPEQAIVTKRRWHHLERSAREGRVCLVQ